MQLQVHTLTHTILNCCVRIQYVYIHNETKKFVLFGIHTTCGFLGDVIVLTAIYSEGRNKRKSE